jgi:hypothetical protein
MIFENAACDANPAMTASIPALAKRINPNWFGSCVENKMMMYYDRMHT